MAAHRRLGLNRDTIRWKMQEHINARRQAAMLDFGRGSHWAVSPDAIASEINYACAVLRRELILKEARRGGKRSFASRHEHYLYLWRCAWHPRRLRLRIGVQS